MFSSVLCTLRWQISRGGSICELRFLQALIDHLDVARQNRVYQRLLTQVAALDDGGGGDDESDEEYEREFERVRASIVECEV
jgi:hypothetical protein